MRRLPPSSRLFPPPPPPPTEEERTRTRTGADFGAAAAAASKRGRASVDNSGERERETAVEDDLAMGRGERGKGGERRIRRRRRGRLSLLRSAATTVRTYTQCSSFSSLRGRRRSPTPQRWCPFFFAPLFPLLFRCSLSLTQLALKVCGGGDKGGRGGKGGVEVAAAEGLGEGAIQKPKREENKKKRRGGGVAGGGAFAVVGTLRSEAGRGGWGVFTC